MYFKSSHLHHPHTVWCLRHINHLTFLILLGLAECKEYTLRYKREHFAEEKLRYALKIIKPIRNETNKEDLKYWKDPPQCMPFFYKSKEVHKSYREYIIYEKSYYAQWNKCTPAPLWMMQGLEELTRPDNIKSVPDDFQWSK